MVHAPVMQSLAPVLIVDAVEPCLPFWKQLGFVVENEVPGDDGKLVFASAKSGGVEIMYQTRASVAADGSHGTVDLTGHSVALFISLADIASLDSAERALSGSPMIKPRHETFYGTTEFYVREPGGNVVGFAAR